VNQQPLMSMCSIWAIMQIQGQHSGFILLKYFMQARSAAVSAPEDSAAFLQTGYAALKSSTQAIWEASVHCWAAANIMRMASIAITKMAFMEIYNYSALMTHFYIYMMLWLLLKTWWSINLIMSILNQQLLTSRFSFSAMIQMHDQPMVKF